MPQQPPTLSLTGWFTVIWMLATSLQYGWHISALNQIQAALTCSSPRKSFIPAVLPPCIPMDDLAFSIVTSSFTVGGLFGSIFANRAMDSFGRKTSIRVNALCVLLGSVFMALSASLTPLVLGRTLIGVGSGLGLCVVPVYLSEISPLAIKGSIGVLNQLGIVTGILVTQSLGIVLAAPTLWRAIPLVAGGLAALQLILSARAVESPAWLSAKSQTITAKAAATVLWGDRPAHNVHDASPEEESLLSPSRDDVSAPPPYSPTSSPTLLTLLRPPLRRPLLVVSLGMIAQQISGINAVLYYSNAILLRVLPGAAAYVSLLVTVVNALMTFPPIYLIERIGRRALITVSAFGAVISLFAVGFGLNNDHVVLASAAVITFVASFAIGLGPVPFVIIPDVSPFYAVSTLSSIALSMNWITNFIVGLVFLPLRNLLSGNDPHHEGRVFYVFAVALLTVYFTWARIYQGPT